MPPKKRSRLRQMNLLLSSRPPLRLPNEKQRDLSAALAELLLNAAEAMRGEFSAEIMREDEDASEVDR